MSCTRYRTLMVSVSSIMWSGLLNESDQATAGFGTTFNSLARGIQSRVRIVRSDSAVPVEPGITIRADKCHCYLRTHLTTRCGGLPPYGERPVRSEFPDLSHYEL